MIVQSTEHIKQFYPVTNEFSYEDLLPFMQSSLEQYIYPYLSREQYELLDQTDLTSLSNDLKKLLPYAQRAITMIALYKYVNVGDKLVGKNGISTNETEAGKMAAQWRLNSMSQFCLDEYDEAIEFMLAFLEDNVSDYDAWANSSAFTQYKNGFINTTEIFDKYFKIGRSRRTFVALRGFREQVEEQYILPILGQAQYDDLKEKIADLFVSADYAKLLAFIQPAVAKLTGARALLELPVSVTDSGVVIKSQSSSLTQNATAAPDPILIKARIQSLETDAQDYLTRLKKFLYSNHSLYPLYEGDTTVYSDGSKIQINTPTGGTYFF